MRDLEKDLSICEAATPGKWEIKKKNIYFDHNDKRLAIVSIGSLEANAIADDDNVYVDVWLDVSEDDARFISEAREGWTYAIKRAIEAENKVEKLVDLCREVIDKILPNESIEHCDIRRDCANEKLNEILGKN